VTEGNVSKPRRKSEGEVPTLLAFHVLLSFLANLIPKMTIPNKKAAAMRRAINELSFTTIKITGLACTE